MNTSNRAQLTHLQKIMFVEPPLPAILPLVLLGTTANTFCFIFFISTNRSSTRRVKLGNELLCLLTSIDFLISLLTYPNFSYPGERFSLVHSTFILPFQTLAEYSVWVTAMISFTRMYLIVLPLRKLSERVVHLVNLAVFIVMFGYYAVLEFGNLGDSLYFNLIYVLLARVSLIISASVICSVVAIRSLRSTSRTLMNSNNEEERTERHRHAAVTVMILVCVSSFLYAFPIPPLIMIILKRHPEGLQAFFSSIPFLTVPLNSVVNPAVYILRNPDMRATLKRHCRHILNAVMAVFCRNCIYAEQNEEIDEFEEYRENSRQCGITVTLH